MRNCEREISKICRKVALGIAEGKLKSVYIRNREQLQEYLGTPRYDFQEAKRLDAVGVVTGMVWTSVGGDILVIEVAAMPGKGKLILTGQLGDVMQESCKAALTYCRANAGMLGIDVDLFNERDIHLHFPAGAIPKDGPSAGITIATAIISLFTNKKISSKVAMTGEITLKGRVLPVGGLKEKLLGAKRAGIRKVLVPKANQKEIDDIASEIKQSMEIQYVDHLDEVLPHAFPTRGKRSAKGIKERADKAVARVRKPAAAKRKPSRKPRKK
jgi:ATP-dependent Lon protease